MPFLEIRAIRKDYGRTRVLDDCSLDIDEGEIVSLLGPSGSGKTTLLNTLAGFVRPDAGRVRLGGADLSAVPPNRRGIGMVFQSYALFPHLPVTRNVAYGLEVRRRPSAEITRRVAEMLELLGLQPFQDRYPHQLSGGQQQRVALARVLVLAPKLLLLDEPFSALDAKLRATVQIELGRLIRRLSLTAVFVTHDQAEALSISSRVAVMRAGRIEQVDTPTALYDFPASRYVADFIGSSNLIPADIASREIALADGEAWPAAATADAVVLIRPENLVITRADDGDCTIGFALHAGPLSEYEVIRAGVPPLRAVMMRPSGADAIAVGARVRVRVRDVGACRVLPR